MPLTPADVHNVAFKRSAIGKRGYDEDEVDEFLDLIEAELSRLIEENNDLRNAAERMRQYGADGPPGITAFGVEQSATQPSEPATNGLTPVPIATGPDVTTPRPAQRAQAGEQTEPPHLAAVRLLEMAQRTADQTMSEATEEANRQRAEAAADADRKRAEADSHSETVRSTAQTESDRLRSETTAESDKLLADARHKAEALTGEARTRSEALERDARTKADALTAEAERKHTEVMGSLEARKTDLEAAISELRNFERQYRVRLRNYLESQLRDLDNHNGTEGAGVAANAVGTSGSDGRPPQHAQT